VRHARATSVRVHAEKTVIKVCVNKECKRAGSKKTCGIFETLAEETDVTIEEVLCLDECGMGPNVEVEGKVVNGVKTEEDVKAVLEKIKR
jgi:NADH:ubiquinone oxidoreductase subunit E